MRLICDKCDKEIEDFSVGLGLGEETPYDRFGIMVTCHGEIAVTQVHSLNPWKEFNTVHYGDLHFFEKDKPEISPEWPHYKAIKMCIDEDKPTWGKGKGIWGKGIAEKLHDLNESMGELRKQFLGIHEGRYAVDSEIVQELSDEIATLEEFITDLQDENDSLREGVKGLERKLLRFREKGDILDDWPEIAGLQFRIKMLEAELEVCKQSLVWTKDKPTKPGQFWFYRVSNLDISHIVVKTWYKGFFNKPETGELWVLFRGSSSPISECTGEWAGPIPEPEGREGEG